jgi:hypothetical protein
VLKELHDRLMELKPEDASHDAAICPVCTGVEIAQITDPISTGGRVKTYTEEEYNALLVQVADLETKVKELDGVRLESEVEAKLAAAKAEAEAQVADLQSQLDASVLEAQSAKDEKDAVLKALEELAEADAKAAEFQARKDERVARVKEVASFPEEHIAARQTPGHPSTRKPLRLPLPTGRPLQERHPRLRPRASRPPQQ